MPLDHDKDTFIGRDAHCTVMLADKFVSKRHARLFYRDSRFFIADLESTNGTFLNSKQIACSPLESGDVIDIHPYTITFYVLPEEAEGNLFPGARGMLDKKGDPKDNFSGQLDILHITDLIQLLNSRRQSGVLNLHVDNNHMFQLVFSNGEIVDAMGEEAAGEDAVYAALDHSQGHFHFIKGAPAEDKSTIDRSTLSLLLEGCRRIDEAISNEPVEEKPTMSDTMSLRAFPGDYPSSPS